MFIKFVGVKLFMDVAIQNLSEYKEVIYRI